MLFMSVDAFFYLFGISSQVRLLKMKYFIVLFPE